MADFIDRLFLNTEKQQTYLDSTSMSLSLNDLMSDRSKNCLADSSLPKHTNTDPWNDRELISNLAFDTNLI